MEPWYSLYWFSPAQWQQFNVVYPLALTLIPVIPVLFFIRQYLYRKTRQQLYISLTQLSTSRRDGGLLQAHQWPGLLRYLLPVSVFVGVSLLMVSLSRPQIVREQRDEQSEGIDIMLAIDVSASMRETDMPPNRLAAARRVAQTFINSRKNDRIGLVVFAGEAFSLCPLTTDYKLLNQYLSALNTGMIRTSGTAIGDALARCINRMRSYDASTPADSTRPASEPADKERSKVIILLSDGDNTAGNLDPLTAAKLAKAFGMRLYTIAVGRPTVSTNEAVTVDEGILKTIATIGNGSFFRATDAKRLRAVFAQINRLEKAPVRVTVYEDVRDYYRVYLYWGISFMLLALLLKTTIFGNVLED